MLNLLQPLAHVVAKFQLDGNEYDVEEFKIGFAQPTDYKGQPQHEVRGGRLIVTLTQTADATLYEWAKKSTMQKSGLITFQTEMSNAVLRVEFTNAYCIRLSRKTNQSKGSSVTLAIAPEIVKMNGIEHKNYWKK